MFAQLLISSLSIGSVYALIALAMVIVYKTTDVPNFAQGELALTAVFSCSSLLQAGLSFALAAPLALAASALLALLLARLSDRDHSGGLELMLMTIGFQFVLQGLVGWCWGARPQSFVPPFAVAQNLRWNGLVLAPTDLANTLTLSLTALGLVLFFRSRWGVAMRAVQENPEAARFNGLPVSRLRALAWVLGAGVGGLAGLLVGALAPLDPALMLDPALKGFAAAVLGGMRSLPGAALGGYLIALADNLFGAYVSGELRTLLTFACIVLALSFKPQGLLGERAAQRGH